jgi:hypothetical protein
MKWTKPAFPPKMPPLFASPAILRNDIILQSSCFCQKFGNTSGNTVETQKAYNCCHPDLNDIAEHNFLIFHRKKLSIPEKISLIKLKGQTMENRLTQKRIIRLKLHWFWNILRTFGLILHAHRASRTKVRAIFIFGYFTVILMYFRNLFDLPTQRAFYLHYPAPFSLLHNLCLVFTIL